MIEMVTEQTIDEVLPLIRKYQAFYHADQFDDQANRMFFSQFYEHSDKGCLFAYRQDKKVVAFAIVYFSYSSTIISKVAIE